MHPRLIIYLHFFREILEAAHAEGIDVAPLKGAHMCAFVYPETEDRGPMADVDFLVRQRDFWRMCRLLERMGYQDTILPHRRVTARVFHEHLFTKQISDKVGLFVEPHRAFIQPAKHDIDYEAVWDRSVPAEFDGVPCRRLCAEDHAAHACLHLETNAFIKPTRGLRDLALLMEQREFSYNLFTAIVRSWGVERAAWLALSLLVARGLRLVPAAFIDELRPPLTIASALRALVLKNQVQALSRNITAARLAVWGLCLSPIALCHYSGYYALLRSADAVVTGLDSWLSHRTEPTRHD